MISWDHDSPCWRIEAEQPVDRDELVRLADGAGPLTGWSPSSRWSGEDVATLMPHVVRVASAVLADRALEVFLAAVVAGETQQAIADRLGIARGSVQQSLHGARRRRGYWLEGPAQNATMVRHGGSVAKVKRALESDAAWQEAVEAVDAPEKVDPRATWFAGYLSPRHHHLFVPLVVLLLLDAIVDATGRTTFDAARQHMPRAALDGSLTQMRLLGWIDTDGVSIRILWRPTDVTETTGP